MINFFIVLVMAVVRYQTKRSVPTTALTALKRVPLIAPLTQIQTARMTQAAAAAVTRRVTVKAAADQNRVQIVKKIVGIRW